MGQYKLVKVLLTVLTVALLLTGCSGNKPSTQQVANDNKMIIVTSFYPMYIATLNVTQGIEGVTVKNMTKPQTGCLHDYQMTPEDLKVLEKSKVFIVNGAGMESFMDKVVKQQKHLSIIEASKDIPLLKDEHGNNPHVWVSVSDAILQVKNITDQLVKVDPVHAEQYKKNALIYIEKLEKLKIEMHNIIDPLPNKNIVTFHEAFPYFAKEFGLNIVEVIEREPGSEPSPKELEETIKKVRELNVKALFAEPQYPAGAANTIAKESGATLYTLDPVVTGEANENSANAYIEAMKKNAKVLKMALQ